MLYAQLNLNFGCCFNSTSVTWTHCT